MGISEPVDYFEHEAVCVKLAALLTVLENWPEIVAKAEELERKTFRGEWMRVGERVVEKEQYYKEWGEAQSGVSGERSGLVNTPEVE